MRRLAALLLALPLAACGIEPDKKVRDGDPIEVRATDGWMYDRRAKAVERFRVTRVGVFTDDLAYGDRRGIYLIVDTTTGREFVGVSGIGISDVGSHSRPGPKGTATTAVDER